MPILLEAPAAPRGGPDGKGWNRLNSGAHFTDRPAQCALQPTTFQHYVESLDTYRARWGGFGRCVQPDGADPCDGCPVLTRTTRLDAFTDRVLVRLNPARPQWAYLMNRPEDGWSSTAQRWTWTDLTHLDGWRMGQTCHDGHGHGFWLCRAAALRTTTPEKEN